MKTILIAALAGGMMTAPLLSLAQDAQPDSRVHVQAQMRQLTQAGYRGSGDETTYPADVDAAARRAGRGVGQQSVPAVESSYGSQLGGTSESGAREPRGPRSLYFGS